MLNTISIHKKPFLTTGEIAQYCHVSRVTVFNWVRAGKLKASRVPSGRYRVLPRDFVYFLKHSDMTYLLDLPSMPRAETRILIADDESRIVETLKTFLEKVSTDYHVAGAESGFEAGKLLQTFKPDVVILDLIMPGMDGFTVCRLIKSDPHTQHVKIIAMTGYTTDENIEKVKDAGADSVFLKPFDYQELLKEIARLTT